MALVIYSSRTGRIRRIVTDPVRNDRELDAYMPKSGGESSVSMRLESSLTAQQTALTARTGLRPTNDRYAAYDANGVVDRIFIGDPDAGDAVRNRTLIADADAKDGWRRDQADIAWERSVREIDVDITHYEDEKTTVNSQAWFDRQKAAFDLTDAEITAKRVARVADIDATIATLTTEKTTRNGTRP